MSEHSVKTSSLTRPVDLPCREEKLFPLCHLAHACSLKVLLRVQCLIWVILASLLYNYDILATYALFFEDSGLKEY